MKRLVMLLLLTPLLAGCGGEAGITATNTPVTVATNTPAEVSAEDTPTVASGGVPGASADLLEVVNYTVTRPVPGSAVILGMVSNKSSSPIAGISVQADIQDASGSTVATGQDQLLAQVALPPGVQAPFMIAISQEVPTDAEVIFQATAQVYDPETMLAIGTPYTDLELKDATLAKGPGDVWQLIGKVSNTGSKTATNVLVLASVYDAAGNIMDVGLGVVPMALAPGADAPIEVTFLSTLGATEGPAKYEATVVGSEQP